MLGYIIGRRDQILKEVYMCSKEEFAARNPAVLEKRIILYVTPETPLAEINETFETFLSDRYENTRFGVEFCNDAIEPWTYVMVFWDTETKERQTEPCADVSSLYDALVSLTAK